MIYTLCISRRLTKDSTTPTDHPSGMPLGQVYDFRDGDVVDQMNGYAIQKRCLYFKTVDLTLQQYNGFRDAMDDDKILMLNCFSTAEKETLSFPGTMPPNLGGEITAANIEVQ